MSTVTPLWPRAWGPNTPTERARFAARIYRDAALSDNPAQAVTDADKVFTAFHESWLFPVVDTGEEWISLDDFAALAQVRRGTVDSWYRHRPPAWTVPPVKVAGRVRRTEVLDFLAARDTHLDQQTAA